AASGVATLVLLRRRRWALARLAAVAAVGSIVVGWGVAQYDWILVDELRIAEAAGARPTLIGLVIVFLVAAVTAVPALVWLFVLVNRDEWQSDIH
ncbi:MAG: cytochrome d ubiquinol oxidase subunit II, partial [Ilumatobacteraceae bacterium]